MAVVFDTNVLVSAAFFATSKPSLALRWAAANDRILASAATLNPFEGIAIITPATYLAQRVG